MKVEAKDNKKLSNDDHSRNGKAGRSRFKGYSGKKPQNLICDMWPQVGMAGN